MTEDKYLGKQVKYPQQYAPEILVAVPRYLNREQYQLADNDLPFIGLDAWHAYELSFLTVNGLPVTGLLKFVYSCTNPSLVESKSLKLYLNSFNMHRFGNTAKEGLALVLNTIQKDLENLLDTEVKLSFHTSNNQQLPFDFNEYEVLEDVLDVDTINFTDFNEAPQLLSEAKNKTKEIKIATHLLRSNCKITHQPDWGSAYIYLKGKNTPDLHKLLQYLVSIRNENHFHEEICEMIYKRLWDKFKPEELMLACIYTRRGGIDICPVRASHEHIIPEALCDGHNLSSKLLRQ
ncbi:NADPH-dependent 7-cyano-7-deazaguanine reductase QueF [Carboxylicivirga sp. N1Y90]|uniref:NADPH-dependent 7-cyano-7-deazaguanine reductase QueF n=1 Tax=Carboxylicivirga fragile TaxID=3417571 RepID=UPI003D33C0E5|nr:NADPH-dependent 7-cyano-7-deazaguanine reductase QueF [Marinilabiliaceae bacterium N1Y90]